MNADERGFDEVELRVQRSMGCLGGQTSALRGPAGASKAPHRIDLCPRSSASIYKYNSSVSTDRFERFTKQASGRARESRRSLTTDRLGRDCCQKIQALTAE